MTLPPFDWGEVDLSWPAEDLDFSLPDDALDFTWPAEVLDWQPPVIDWEPPTIDWEPPDLSDLCGDLEHWLQDGRDQAPPAPPRRRGRR